MTRKWSYTITVSYCLLQISLHFFPCFIDGKMFETSDFRGCSKLEFSAHLRGGVGDGAWQHAQLFRQKTSDNEDYPLDIIIRLKKCL
jgi:hypothetical protein